MYWGLTGFSEPLIPAPPHPGVRRCRGQSRSSHNINNLRRVEDMGCVARTSWWLSDHLRVADDRLSRLIDCACLLTGIEGGHELPALFVAIMRGELRACVSYTPGLVAVFRVVLGHHRKHREQELADGRAVEHSPFGDERIGVPRRCTAIRMQKNPAI